MNDLYVGKLLKAKPAVRRVSRTKVFRGYLMTYVKAVKDDGTSETFDIFKPVLQYDRAVLSTNKYQPHQGKRECERRRIGGFAMKRWAEARGF